MGILLAEVEILIILATENGQHFPCKSSPSAVVKVRNSLGFVGLTWGFQFPASDRLE